jgi:hypothetical protein
MFNILFEGLAFTMVGMVGWIALSIFCALWLFISVGGTKYIQAGACLALYVIFGLNYDVVVRLLSRPDKFFLWLFIYLVIGALWSIIKWYIFLHKDLRRFLLEKDYSSEAKTTAQDTVLVQEDGEWVKRYLLHKFRNKWCRCVAPNSERDYLNEMPFKIEDHTMWRPVILEPNVMDSYTRWNGDNNKEKILTWILYWPVSLWWSLMDDFIKNAAKKIQYLLRGGYDKIQDHVYSKVKKDIGK